VPILASRLASLETNETLNKSQYYTVETSSLSQTAEAGFSSATSESDSPAINDFFWMKSASV
jgi:hypothetical protein